MLASLAHHPFGVEAFFRRSLVLTYALPAAALEPWLGPGLRLDTYGTFGFLAIALVQTEALRPRPFPRLLGRDFFLSGYRIFTRFPRRAGAELRGLKILRSDTDRWSMKTAGNVFTQYRYRLARVSSLVDGARWSLAIQTPGREADLRIDAELEPRPSPLPDESVFRSMDDALHFAGPLPFTFSYDAGVERMVVVKGIRKSWAPQSVRVEVAQATFLEQPAFSGVRPILSNAFYLENIPYAWDRGTLEPLA